MAGVGRRVQQAVDRIDVKFPRRIEIMDHQRAHEPTGADVQIHIAEGRGMGPGRAWRRKQRHGQREKGEQAAHC